jgi:hypothetical protein
MSTSSTSPTAPEPKPSTAPRAPREESLVAACDATGCTYNRDSACTAGAVTIAFVAGKPVCAAYSPRASDGEE